MRTASIDFDLREQTQELRQATQASQAKALKVQNKRLRHKRQQASQQENPQEEQDRHVQEEQDRHVNIEITQNWWRYWDGVGQKRSRCYYWNAVTKTYSLTPPEAGIVLAGELTKTNVAEFERNWHRAEKFDAGLGTIICRATESMSISTDNQTRIKKGTNLAQRTQDLSAPELCTLHTLFAEFGAGSGDGTCSEGDDDIDDAQSGSPPCSASPSASPVRVPEGSSILSNLPAPIPIEDNRMVNSADAVAEACMGVEQTKDPFNNFGTNGTGGKAETAAKPAVERGSGESAVLPPASLASAAPPLPDIVMSSADSVDSHDSTVTTVDSPERSESIGDFKVAAAKESAPKAVEAC